MITNDAYRQNGRPATTAYQVGVINLAQFHPQSTRSWADTAHHCDLYRVARPDRIARSSAEEYVCVAVPFARPAWVSAAPR